MDMAESSSSPKLLVDLLQDAAASDAGLKFLDNGSTDSSTYVSYAQLYQQAKVGQISAIIRQPD